MTVEDVSNINKKINWSLSRAVLISRTLQAMIAHSTVQSIWTLSKMLFCLETPQQCLIEQSSFTNWDSILGDDC